MLLDNTHYTENWEVLEKDSVERALVDLNEKLHSFEKMITKHRETLNYLKSTEDIYSQLDNIYELEEEIENIKYAIGELSLMLETYYVYPYDDEDNPTEDDTIVVEYAIR